jgi:hypothetical protein
MPSPRSSSAPSDPVPRTSTETAPQSAEHKCAKGSVDQDRPAQVLQRIMRHADIKTTLDFYADVEQAAHDAVWGKQPAKVTTPETAVA